MEHRCSANLSLSWLSWCIACYIYCTGYTQLGFLGSQLCPFWIFTIERLSITFTSNGRREFVLHDQFPPLLVVYGISVSVVSRNFLSIKIFWAVFICSFSILENSQLESDVCRLPYTWSLKSQISLLYCPVNYSREKKRAYLCSYIYLLTYFIIILMEPKPKEFSYI